MNWHLRSLLGGAGLRVLVYAAAVLIGLFLTPYLVRHLGDRQYAVFVFAGLFTNWCGLVDFGMTTSSARFVTLAFSRGEPRRLSETAASAFLLFALMAVAVLLISGAGAFLCRRFVPAAEASLYASVLLFAGGSFAVSKLADAFSGVLNGVMRQDLTGAAALLCRLALGGATFLIVWLGGNVAVVTAGWLAVSLANLFLLALLARAACPALRLSLRLIRKERIRELLGYSVFTFIQQLGTLLVRRSDLLVIGAFLTLTDVAHYSLAVVTLASYFVTFSEELTGWLTNWFTHLAQSREEERLRRSRLFAYKAMTFLTVFMALILIFWARDFLTCWIGPEYLDAFPCLALIAGGMALYRGSADVNIRFLQGLARHQFLAPLAVGQGIVGILLAVAAVKLGFGLPGVAVATILPAAAVGGIWIPLLVCRRTGERPLFYFLRQLRFLLTALAVFLPSYLAIRLWLTPAPARLACVLVLATSLWLAAVFFFGFTRNERKTLLSFFRARR